MGMSMYDIAMSEDFITKTTAKDQVYEFWLTRIDLIEKTTIGKDTSTASLDIGFFLFPLIESISYTLFNSGGRKYLEELGVSHPDLVYKMFRNGLTHNMSSYRLSYGDGDVHASLFSSGGSGGFIPYDKGYTSEEYPEDNMPAETVFEYKIREDGYNTAWLMLDRLTAQIRHDLHKRKIADDRESIELIIGKVIDGDMPSE